MDAYVRKLLKKERSEMVFLVAITLLAVAVRILVRSFVAEDWSVYWSDWLLQLKDPAAHECHDCF